MTSAFRSVGLACLVCAATVACEPKPRIEITGRYAGPLQVPEPVALPPVIVTNRDGSLVLPPPELVWTVDPPSVAQVVGDDLVPKQNGAAALRARIAGSDQSAAVGLVVSLVDDIQLRCPDDCELEVGNERSVTAVARAEGRDAQVKPKWSSSDERVVSVDEEGRITAQAPGEAKLTAAIGRVSKSLVVDVKSPLTRVALTCEVTGERIEATLEQPQAIGEKSCALGIRSETRLVLEAYRGDTRVHEDLNERWQTTDERIASMDAGLVRGLNLGPAFVGVEVGTLSLSFPAEVLSKPPRAAGRPRAVGTCQQSALRNTPATVSYYRRTGRGGGRYGRRYTPTRRVEVTLACQDLDASACARRRVPLAGRTGGSAAVISAATACCCSVRKTQTR